MIPTTTITCWSPQRPLPSCWRCTASAQVVPSPDSDAPNAPAVRITNGLVTAVLYLPDAERGYYRATRFDWSGVIASLEAGGHSYFGRWNPKYDPKLHDAISGPVQEFVTGQGFEAAKPGETFVKIGVGVLRKPAEPVRGFATLEIVDGGKWSTKVGTDSVEFVHEVNDPRSGSAIANQDRGLARGQDADDADAADRIHRRQPDRHRDVQPQLLRPGRTAERAGRRGAPALQARGLQRPWRRDSGRRRPAQLPQANRDGQSHAAERLQRLGRRLRHPRGEPQDGRGRARDLRSSVVRHGASGRRLGTTCPEAYIHVHAERGRPMDWTTTYDFYSLPAAPK